MSQDDPYLVGQRCWFPHEVEGFVSGDLVDRVIAEDGSIRLLFTDEVGRVSHEQFSTYSEGLKFTGTQYRDHTRRTQQT